jgi:hypothetical protein
MALFRQRRQDRSDVRLPGEAAFFMQPKSPLDKEDVPRNGNSALIATASALT